MASGAMVALIPKTSDHIEASMASTCTRCAPSRPLARRHILPGLVSRGISVRLGLVVKPSAGVTTVHDHGQHPLIDISGMCVH